MSVKPISGFRQRARRVAAFSLVEVVLAVGILAFALIVMVALLPLGLKSNSDSVGESQAVNLLQAVIADRQSSAYTNVSSIYGLPAINNVTTTVTKTFYVNEDAVTTSTVATSARYRVDYAIYPASSIYATATNYPAAGPIQPVAINLRVSWPAAQAVHPSSVETVATFMQ